jgi:hypothetical protein
LSKEEYYKSIEDMAGECKCGGIGVKAWLLIKISWRHGIWLKSVNDTIDPTKLINNQALTPCIPLFF